MISPADESRTFRTFERGASSEDASGALLSASYCMYALTLKEPWAWAIAAGLKDYENRTWPPYREAIGQLVAIHAGKSFDVEGAARFEEIMRGYPVTPPTRAEMPYGAVIAVARIAGVIGPDQRPPDSPWFFGPYGWKMTEVLAIAPVPCRGMPGLWSLPPDIETRVLAALGEAQLRQQIQSKGDTEVVDLQVKGIRTSKRPAGKTRWSPFE